MKTVNRLLAVLKPKQPYADWINSLPGNSPQMTIEELNEDLTSYLIPVYDTNEEARSFIHNISKRILEVECGSWDASGDYWPKNLNKKLLKEFFDIEICSEVIDTMSGPIEREDYY